MFKYQIAIPIISMMFLYAIVTASAESIESDFTDLGLPVGESRILDLSDLLDSSASSADFAELARKEMLSDDWGDESLKLRVGRKDAFTSFFVVPELSAFALISGMLAFAWIMIRRR